MLIIAQVLKEKWLKSPVLLIHKQQTNLWIKLPTIPPGLAGKIVKKPPALGTNQIAGFGGFRPLATLENNNIAVFHVTSPNDAYRQPGIN